MEVIYHLAAAVGVGQSMYEIAHYMESNTQGTANLLQALLDGKLQFEKLIVASSMSIYGEGQYRCPEHGEVAPPPRAAAQLRAKNWELRCPACGAGMAPVATPESKPLQCTSIYALSKKDQEEMTLLFGRTYNVPVVALRYFNIYGTRQSLSNPYTGVAAIFASRLLNGNAPMIFEDGRQQRDFVSVHDVVQANLLAMERSQADGMALNIGSGEAVTIEGVARALSKRMACEIPAEITGKYRAGDIRHCFADISAARRLLGYEPKFRFQPGSAGTGCLAARANGGGQGAAGCAGTRQVRVDCLSREVTPADTAFAKWMRQYFEESNEISAVAMHVLVTADTVGGVWIYTRELVAGLVRRGVRVTLVSFGEIPTAAQTEWLEGLRGVDFHPTGFSLGVDAGCEAGHRPLQPVPDVAHRRGSSRCASPQPVRLRSAADRDSEVGGCAQRCGELVGERERSDSLRRTTGCVGIAVRWRQV